MTASLQQQNSEPQDFDAMEAKRRDKKPSVYWEKIGTGPDLVLIHGWGMNGAVWDKAAAVLSGDFTVHRVDLPGFGYSHQGYAPTLADMAEQVLHQAPTRAIWLGWSLGGLVATHIGVHHPERVEKLITLASSPKFSAEKPWRGIQAPVLAAFTQQLVDDFSTTVERFMALQAMGSPSARQDVKTLKQAVLSRPSPNPEALLAGLGLLAEVDLRSELSQISVPFLRLYGRLDGLVPIKVAHDCQPLAPASQQHIFSDSSHAPFMTETEAFCEKIRQFGLNK